MSGRAMKRAQERKVTKERRRQSRLGKRAAVAGGAALGATVLFAPAADAATFTVTNLTDADEGSLRDRIADADAAAGDDVVNFQAGLTGTITLTSGQISLYSNSNGDSDTDAITVAGPGPNVITVSGNNASRIFYAHVHDPSPVVISGLTLTEGNSVTGPYIYYDGGGAAHLRHGVFGVDNVVVTSSETNGGDGGGLYVNASYGYSAPSEISNAVISGNNSEGGDGGGASLSDVELTNTTISGNQTDGGDGGGLQGYGNELTGTTISGNNSEGGDGGGLQGYGNELTGTTISGNNSEGGDGGGLDGSGNELTDVTLSGNAAGAGGGGGIRGSNSLFDVTVSGNSAADGGGIFGSSDMRRTTVSGNTATDDGGGIFLYSLYNGALRNSTVSGNTAGDDGGGINFAGAGEDPGIVSATIAGNSAAEGGGIFQRNSPTADDDDLGLTNTIVADNTGGDLAQEAGTATATFRLDFSLIENPGSAPRADVTAGSNIIGQDPQLGPLADNAFFVTTQTHALPESSPAVDSGTSALNEEIVLNSDQRGEDRPSDQPDVANAPGSDGSDIGAFELQAAPEGSCQGRAATVILAAPGEVTLGTFAPDVIVGDGGANIINGKGGNDIICAGGGNDIVTGGAGADSLRGGAGKDDLSGGGGGDTARGQGGNDDIAGDGGNDTLRGGGGKDNITGSPGADTASGGSGRDRLVGSGGRDRLSGNGAADVLLGSAGRDNLKGGRGPDRLVGGAGVDVLNGGPGNDIEIQG